MAAYTSGIDQNFLQKTKLQLKQVWAKWTKTRLKTQYMRPSLKVFKVKKSFTERSAWTKTSLDQKELVHTPTLLNFANSTCG